VFILLGDSFKFCNLEGVLFEADIGANAYCTGSTSWAVTEFKFIVC
jgi:hypothetical protein